MGQDRTNEVSIAATLRRTGFLVGLTMVFMAIVRFCPPVSHTMQFLAGSKGIESLYTLFHAQEALEREQILLGAIVVVCFLCALAIQLIGLWTLRYYHRRRH